MVPCDMITIARTKITPADGFPSSGAPTWVLYWFSFLTWDSLRWLYGGQDYGIVLPVRLKKKWNKLKSKWRWLYSFYPLQLVLPSTCTTTGTTNRPLLISSFLIFFYFPFSFLFLYKLLFIFLPVTSHSSCDPKKKPTQTKVEYRCLK